MSEEKELPFAEGDTELRPFNPLYYNTFYTDYGKYRESFQRDVMGFHVKSDILNCTACNLREFKKPLPLANFSSANLMVIGEKPEDVDFSTDSGRALAKTMRGYGFDLDDIYFTSAVKCEGADDVKQCNIHLVSEIMAMNPSVIMALGYQAGHMLMPIEKNGKVNPGDVTTLPNGSDMIITYKIGNILEDEKAQNIFCQHLTMTKSQLEMKKQQKGR